MTACNASIPPDLEVGRTRSIELVVAGSGPLYRVEEARSVWVRPGFLNGFLGLCNGSHFGAFELTRPGHQGTCPAAAPLPSCRVRNKGPRHRQPFHRVSSDTPNTPPATPQPTSSTKRSSPASSLLSSRAASSRSSSASSSTSPVPWPSRSVSSSACSSRTVAFCRGLLLLATPL